MRPAELPSGARFRVPGDVILRALISLALALLLWSWVTTQRDPTETRTYTDIPIVPPTLAAPLQIAGDFGSVSLQLEGPRSALDGIFRDDLEPQLDVSAVQGPGSYTVPVTLVVPPAVRVARITPPRLSIVVDETASRTVHLDVQTTPPKDATRQIASVQPEVSEVTVSGPRRLVDEVARVVLPIDIGDRTTTFTDQFTAVAQNAQGQPIPEVDLRPRRISATVTVQTRGRTVPVLIQTIGNPADGYEVVDRVANPSTVLLDGPDATLNDLVSVLTAPINVDGATQPISARVGLIGLPANVRVVDPPSGQVTAVIQVRQRGVTQTLQNQPVRVANVGPNLTAIPDPTNVSVVIFASEDALARLRGSDVLVQVSVEGLGPGVYQLKPQVIVPPEVQWIRTDPGTVTVTIQRGSATPVADDLEQAANPAPSAQPPQVTATPIATPRASPTP